MDSEADCCGLPATTICFAVHRWWIDHEFLVIPLCRQPRDGGRTVEFAAESGGGADQALTLLRRQRVRAPAQPGDGRCAGRLTDKANGGIDEDLALLRLQRDQ